MKIDLFVDLNTEDEKGLPWTDLDQAADPSLVVPGRLLVVGAGSSVAVADVVDVEADGIVHVRPLPGLGERPPRGDGLAPRLNQSATANEAEWWP